MAIAIFNINQIYKAQFGTVGEPLPTGGQPVVAGSSTIIRCPLKMAYDGDEHQYPLEPLVSVQGKNIVTRTPILKNRDSGTVKELWSADDYQIEIKGIILGSDPERLPSEEINQIRKFCEVKGAVEVNSPYLTLFGIQFMTIEDYDFMHTPGYNNQAYIIKGYSDKPFELF
jgi:hypothetical protein